MMLLKPNASNNNKETKENLMDKTTGLTHLIKSTQYSMQGLKSAVSFDYVFN